MSYLLYSTRVWWDGHHGVAALHRCYRKLSVAPAFLHPLVRYIDYAPEVRVAQLRLEAEPMRDMSPEEIAMADAYLREMFPAPAPPTDAPGQGVDDDDGAAA